MSGRASFVVGGEDVDVPAGSAVRDDPGYPG